MEEIIAATKGAGTQVLKFRGGMPLLGMTRVFGLYRMANSMALLDAKIRGVGPDQALGGRGFDNYSWHTDLPPGPSHGHRPADGRVRSQLRRARTARSWSGA